MRRTNANKLKVVAVRLDPAIEHRLRLLASVTGRKQSVFLHQIIDAGLGAIEEAHLPPHMLAQIRAVAAEEAAADAAPDLFGAGSATQTQSASPRPRARQDWESRTTDTRSE
ncbi:hypothetical protein KNO81_41220 [Paraburkholderia sediminicola]|nr:hypothetical protein [Paraburkholderia sediminicola]